MEKPTSSEILVRIHCLEEIRDQAEAAGDVEHMRRAVKILGILWAAFTDRMGQRGRLPEEFEKMYLKVH